MKNLLLRCWLVATVSLTLIFPLGTLAARLFVSDGSIIMGEIIDRSEDVYIVRMEHGAEVQIRVCEVVRIEGAGKELSPDLSVHQSTLRFAGSNTVGESLLPALAEAYISANDGGEIQWTAGARENEKILKVDSTSKCVPEEIEVKAHGSSTAFEALKAGETDIGMSSRPIKQTEVDTLATLGDLTNPASEHVLALDGLAVIIHPSNPVQALGKQEIAQIFAGKISDWSHIGGNPGPINIYARDDKSGTYDTFKTLVLKSHGRALSPAARRFESSEELSDSVASDPNGIGFIGLSYIRKAKPLNIKECGLSYSPSTFAVKTEEYPLARRLFLYTPRSPHSLLLKDFIRFALSADGQTITKKIGFVDLAIESSAEGDRVVFQLSRMRSALKNVRNLNVLKDFVETTEGATRLSVSFRFRKNSTKLDNRARADIKRLAAYMKSGEGSGKQLMLLGFSDTQGVYSKNLSLSKARAQSVANQLTWNAVRGALIKGFGEELAVACNDNPAGYEKNRHVEVWVK